MSKTIKDFFIMASGEILSEWLPEDWPVWKDEELNKWLEQHACEPYEGWSGEELWEQIDSVAHSLMGIHNDATGNERLLLLTQWRTLRYHKQRWEKAEAENERLREDCKFLLSFAPEEVPPKLFPMSYHTLTYKGDLKLQERIDGIKEALEVNNDEEK